MRNLLPALAVSLVIWGCIAQGAVTVAHHIAPNLLPSAKHEAHHAMAAARRLILAQGF